MAKSEEYSSYATNLFFKDSESDRAKRFQDSNSILIDTKLLLKNILLIFKILFISHFIYILLFNLESPNREL